MPNQADIAIVGAGIMGLAHAYHAAKRGLKVALFERSPQAETATVQNFGHVTIAAQPTGVRLRRALRARELWLEVAPKAQLWHQHCGAIIAVHSDLEVQLMEEFIRLSVPQGHDLTLLDVSAALAKVPQLQAQQLKAAVWSPTDIRVDPRQAAHRLAAYLSEQMGVEIYFNTVVREVTDKTLQTAQGDTWHFQHSVVCSGHDYESLFPEVFAPDITRCRLHMVRTLPQPVAITPAISSGLSVLHNAAYRACPSLEQVRAQFAASHPEHLRYRIHLIVNQHGDNTLTIGDSHEIGDAVEPYNSVAIEACILDELKRVLTLPEPRLLQRWQGVYSYSDKRSYFIGRPYDTVRTVTITTGNGMTVGFALAEEVIAELLDDQAVETE